MSNELAYRGITVSEGVALIEAQLSEKEHVSASSFSDLHDYRDANTLLPFHEDVGNTEWLAFANSVIEMFDSTRQ